MSTALRPSSFTLSVVKNPPDYPLCFTLTVGLYMSGYYPPNHQPVIGTDPLEPFEEPAELLGQAKPQTASKEDIDNSGLEVIRMNVLAEYEKTGRVAPMCVDRVRASQFFIR
jgi:hypothetical protein